MKFAIGVKVLTIMTVATGSRAAAVCAPLCCNLVGTVNNPLITAALNALAITIPSDGLVVGVDCIPDVAPVGIW